MLTMRELRGDDLFTLLTIITKLDIQDEFITLFESNDQLVSAEALEQLRKKHKDNQQALENELKQLMTQALEKRGMVVMARLITKALSNIGKIKDDLNGFLSDLCRVEVKEIKELGLKEYTDLVVSFFKKPELKSFFTSIVSLMR